MRVHNHAACFDPRFVQRLTLFQPSPEALIWLARRDVHMSYMEVSLDWTFENEAEKDDAFAFVCRYLVKQHHRSGQGIRFVGKDGKFTRYTAARGAPNLIAMYADKPSKATGEIFCVHLDWRISRAYALRRAGIYKVSDLINFNHQEFCARQTLPHPLQDYLTW